MLWYTAKKLRCIRHPYHARSATEDCPQCDLHHRVSLLYMHHTELKLGGKFSAYLISISHFYGDIVHLEFQELYLSDNEPRTDFKTLSALNLMR